MIDTIFRTKMLIAAAGIAGSLLVGCAAEGGKPPTLKDGYAKYSARQVEESESIADRFIAANPQNATLDEAYYLRGLSRMTRGDRIGATADLHEAINHTVRVDLKSKAWRAIGDIAFDKTQWAEAERAYHAAIDAGGANAATITYLNFRVGTSLQAQGEWTRGVAWFGRVVASNNDQTLKTRALARMHATSYALQFGAFQDAARARDMVAQLKTAGIAATIPVDVREGQVLYLVQGGAYPTMAAAMAARDAVQGRYPLVAIVP